MGGNTYRAAVQDNCWLPDYAINVPPGRLPWRSATEVSATASVRWYVPALQKHGWTSGGRSPFRRRTGALRAGAAVACVGLSRLITHWGYNRYFFDVLRRLMNPDPPPVRRVTAN
jgi:hypothetical protein